MNNANIKIEKLVPGGQGIGVAKDGKKGFFWNALPGETVIKYHITKNKSHYFEAIAEETKEHSPYRIGPKDPCFLSTSPWQIMDYNYELTQKFELLKEQFNQFGITLKPSNVQTDHNDFYYRNKMEYSLYWDNDTNDISLAFHERGSHRKMPIKKSSIERPEILETAQKIVNELNANHEEARKYQSLLLRCNQKGEVSGGLYENKKPHPTFKNLTDVILGQTYSYSPNGFFQINLPIYEMALTEIKKHIKTNKVLDLYAGVGTIGLSVADDKELTLVECNKFAFQELENNCKNTKGATKQKNAILANSENALDYITPDSTVIVDPPRAGCDVQLLNRLIEVMPPCIVYLSCNPATQARDVKNLLDSKKYIITSVTPFNFFPRTPHLENLIVLEKI